MVSVGQASVDPTTAPHIALLLPTGSDVFAKPAEAVRSGFLEAAKKRVTDLRTALWAPKEKVRVVAAESTRDLPATD